MKRFFKYYLFVVWMVCFKEAHAQTDSVFKWEVSSEKIGDKQYEISFFTNTQTPYILYAPNQNYDGYHTVELQFADSAVLVEAVKDSGKQVSFSNPLFGNAETKGYENGTRWTALLTINGKVPAQLSGNLLYTFGRGDELYPSTAFPFTIDLEGGEKPSARIRIPTIDINHPLNNCGDDEAGDKGLLAIFLLGFGGGLIALLTPCVFPMIPLTVSFFTKQEVSRKKGIANASLYAAFIFLIYLLLSLPFHLMDHLDPEVLNTISTNAWLNLAFFVVFVFFAFSFFGFYEIQLPSGFANRIGSKAGGTSMAGILFMALTLAIVSFSCTGPILGSLLAGAITNEGGATQLTFGMGGFGLGLALPFAVFSIFPQWLRSMPRSGGWLTTVKVILGFLELALAVKFFSNADLVKQWGFLKREVFIGIWILIGFAMMIYLMRNLRWRDANGVSRISNGKLATLSVVAAFTIYLLPGVTNTSLARLTLISGFPPPVCYSIYDLPVNCANGVQPLHDYEEALKRAKKENKPLLIDFTGWACVNCRRMEEKVWTNEEVRELMNEKFIVVSLYVDERTPLPLTERTVFITRNGTRKQINTVGDKWASFQSENFNAVSQPQYAIISNEETALTRKKTYTPDPEAFLEWLKCGLDADKKNQKR